MTAPARLDRAAFDALVQRKAMALVDGGVGSDEAFREANQEAKLLEAQAREFADAVDRNGKLSYEEAVVIIGDSGVVVVDAEDYRREPVYWEAHAGKVDSLILGPLLVAALREP